MPAHDQTPGCPSARPTTSGWWPALALAVDAALIILFATLGRRTHESGMDPAGILWTALPFLIAWAAATLATHRSWTRLWPSGVVVWLVTVVGGLLLRVLFGDTAAFSFQLVTAGVLGVFLLSRRLVTALLLHPGRTTRS
ncbi:MAG: DUF3054 domain-containing protein [Micrococcus sp.]|nr:DUF3054 domain-containing protein [Micrococcus sp.]